MASKNQRKFKRKHAATTSDHYFPTQEEYPINYLRFHKPEGHKDDIAEKRGVLGAKK
jgi:hypothetical protein